MHTCSPGVQLGYVQVCTAIAANIGATVDDTFKVDDLDALDYLSVDRDLSHVWRTHESGPLLPLRPLREFLYQALLFLLPLLRLRHPSASKAVSKQAPETTNAQVTYDKPIESMTRARSSRTPTKTHAVVRRYHHNDESHSCVQLSMQRGVARRGAARWGAALRGKTYT